MKINAAIAAAILAYTSTTSAHMLLANPVGFVGNQDPLHGAADFPCGAEKTGGYQVKQLNKWAAGSTQTVQFLGTATHSGGSCQFALTTDDKPTPNSKWHVIGEKIGNCPMDHKGKNGNANEVVGVPASATWPVPDKFPVTVPKDAPNGKATFAWIWFNKTGQREMYMKCAPIEITGGANNANGLNKLKEIRKANIGNGCTTIEGKDVNFQTGDGFVGNCGGGGGGGASPPPPPPVNNKPPPPPNNNPPKPGNGGGSGDCAGKPDGFQCLGESKWATCVGGKGTPMAVAPGTKCKNGQISARRVRRRNGGSIVRGQAFRA